MELVTRIKSCELPRSSSPELKVASCHGRTFLVWGRDKDGNHPSEITEVKQTLPMTAARNYDDAPATSIMVTRRVKVA